MGMSASQARLLSITSRLTDNELRSQTITTAKMSLATRSKDASAEYMAAMKNTELLFSNYDAKGSKVYQKLTGATLSEYAPLKNQYGLVNKHGQILVSERDALNYKESANIAEFLEKYGFENVFEQKFDTVINEEEYKGSDEFKKYLEDLKNYEDRLDEWQGREPQKDDFTKNVQTGTTHVGKKPDKGDFEIPDPNWVAPPVDEPDKTWSLYDAFINGTAGGCFSCSSNPSSPEYNLCRHFNHVLAHMLVNGGHGYSSGRWWDKPEGGRDGTSGDEKIMKKIAEAIVGKKCCGAQGCTEHHKHNLYGTEVEFDCGQELCDPNELLTDKIQRLMDDIGVYAKDNVSAKGDDNDPAWIALKQRYYHLIEHDLKGVIGEIKIEKDPPEPPMIFDKDGYDEALKEWEDSEQPVFEDVVDEDAFNEAHDEWEKEGEELVPPEKPDPTLVKETFVSFEVTQQSEEGQWYINLWHRMNGLSNIKTRIPKVDNGAHDENQEELPDGDNVTNQMKGLTNSNLPLWTVLEDGLMNNPDWLKNALGNNSIILERVNFTNPTESGTGLKNWGWESLPYTSASDISEELNEVEITKAEAKYKQALADIESKDKQYDNQLKNLDTEHSALQTEYDTVKGVIGKNIDRTLKLYS